MPVRSILRFDVQAGREADFENAFEASGMLTRPKAVAGFLGAELLRSDDSPTEYYVIGRWASAEAYAQWQQVSLEAPDARSTASLFDTLVDPRPGRLFSAVSTSS